MCSITISQYRAAIGGFYGKTSNFLIIPFKFYPFQNLFQKDNVFGDWQFCSHRRWSKFVHLSRNRNSSSRLLFCYITMFSIITQMLLLTSGSIHPNPGPQENNQLGCISICHSNIRSLRNAPEKVDHIFHALSDKYNIITVSETWLDNSINSSYLIRNGYQLPFRKDRFDNQGYGGVLAWVPTYIAAKRRSDLESYDLEAMWLEVRCHNNKFLLCTIYRPPNSGNQFWTNLQLSIDSARNTEVKNIILTGDLNADQGTYSGNKLADFVSVNNFKLHINEPTRITPSSSTILDQFITNIPNYITNIIIDEPVSNSDHCTIGIQLQFRIKRNFTFKRFMWDFKNADFNLFRTKLLQTDFSFCNNIIDINDTCKKWSSLVLEVAKSVIPGKEVTVRSKDKSWYNNNLRKLLRIKDRSHKIAKSSNTPEDWAQFRYDRNRYFAAVKECKTNFEKTSYQKLIDHSSKNPKKWWKVLKEILGQCDNSEIPPIHVNDEILVDTKEKANAFNEYFSSVTEINDLNQVLPDNDPSIINNENCLNQVTITEQDVLDQLKILDINKAYGPDSISPKILKEAAHVLAPSLCKIFNASLIFGKIPSIWKEANVLPLYKKGSPADISNYRPVSLLCTPSKILEKIIYKHLYNHFRDNFLLSIWQSGFLPGNSTVSQLIELYHNFCEAVSNGKEVRVIFLDISKAFDRVWHKGLLYKLRKFGITDSLLTWFKEYLTNRRQRVVINGQTSDWAYLRAGVPQGSVLGPLLFLVFINDITSVVKSCQIRLFADDTCLFLTVDDRIDAAIKINNDLARIQNWADKWLVSFSPSKTKAMTISNKRDYENNPSIFLCNHIVDQVNTHKHLGITLSHNLKWSHHIQNISNTCMKQINVMKSLKFKLDRKSLETIYMSFIRPKMEYGNILFAGASLVNLQKLDNIQLEAMRIVTGATYRARIKSLFDETAWNSLQERRENQVLCMLFKIMNNLSPVYLSGILLRLQGTEPRYNLRNNLNLRPPYTKTETYRNSFFPFAIRIWNLLPLEKKQKKSFSEFKTIFINRKDPNQKLLYYGERWPSIHHARIRMGCSKLNEHLCNNLHVIQNPNCACGYPQENPSHFFLECPLYAALRIDLFNSITPITQQCTIKLLLNGDNNMSKQQNEMIFSAVHHFIIESKRFQ